MALKYNFEWDYRKTLDNREKHDVSFEEAVTVFKDSRALPIIDPEHSETEDRWVTMCISEKGRLLVVIHTFRENKKEGVAIRIISSRKATKKEIKTYGE